MNNRIFTAIFMIGVGLALFLFGMNSADSLSDRLSKFFTGHFTEFTTWLLVFGMIAGIAGLVMLITARGRRTSL